jgi:uncharacterized protein YkwD
VKGFFGNLALVLGIGVMGFCLYMGISGYVAAQDTVGVARQAFDLINQERERLKVSPLIWSDTLAEKAIAYSEQMKETGIFEHSDMNYGENILMGSDVFSNGYHVYHPWEQSPGHYSNMIDKDYTYAAIGIFDNYATFLAY